MQIINETYECDMMGWPSLLTALDYLEYKIQERLKWGGSPNKGELKFRDEMVMLLRHHGARYEFELALGFGFNGSKSIFLHFNSRVQKTCKSP